MALEVATYINDLVGTNPVAADPKSQGDDHIRLVKTAIKQTLNGFPGAILLTATDTGTAAAHVMTPATALVGYTPMLCLLYRPAVTNAGAITVNVSALGAKSVKTMAGADPTAGDIVAGQPVLLMYDGTNFVTLAGSEFLSKTGNQTLTGNLTLAGNQTITGNQATTGTMGVTGNTTLGGTLAVTGVITSPTIALKADLASPALTGTPTAPTAAPGTNTTQIATMAALVAAAFSAALPGQAGNAGKFVTTDGTTASWGSVIPPSVVRSARTSNTILGTADSMALIDVISGTFTQTFAAAAALGSGWYCYLRNSGTGDITLDPNASELIDGLTSYVMYPGECRLVQCNGVAFTSVVLSSFYKAFTTSGNFTKPPGYSQFGGLLWSAGASGGKGSLAGGGGGGACLPILLSAALFGTIEAIAIGAGGAAQATASTSGSVGGNSSIGSLATVFGGAFGNGSGSQRGGTGGRWLGTPPNDGTSGDYLGATLGNYFAAMGGAGGAGYIAAGFTSGKHSNYGGGGGGQEGTFGGGMSTYGGGGGGGSGAGAEVAGVSAFGGSGGAGIAASSGASGTAPAGGGGATATGAQSGAGARGELRISGII